MNAAEKILIIDDEPQMRMNLRALLEDIGYQVLEAGSGPEGLERAASARPDLILLDVRMPGMDGLEVCARLKADSDLRPIPVIFLSGVLEAQEKVRAFQAGGVDYVTKPFHFEEVEARVRTRLDLGKAQRRLEAQNRTLQSALAETETLNRKLIGMNERLRQSEALKSQFLATMRNEINNPLNAILALTMELEKGGIPPDRARMIGALVATEACGLDFQIRNIFCAAELEAGDASPHASTVDAGAVLQDAIDALSHQAEARAVQVNLAGAAAGADFCTDPGMLRAIAVNLLSNAIKFSPEGGAVQARLRRVGPALELEVEDAGRGIRAEDQALIFEPFRQLQGGPARAHQGQGLGLSVVQALVDLLGGQIAVASEPGRGARFTCAIPERQPQDPTRSSSAEGNTLYFGETEEID